MNNLIEILRRRHWIARLESLTDGSAWLLFIPCALLLLYIDPIDFKVMMAWLARLPIIVGVVIIISRIFFPSIKLTDYLQQAKEGNIAAGIVVAGLMLFTSMLVMTAAGWSK